jgi:hypothetical protein
MNELNFQNPYFLQNVLKCTKSRTYISIVLNFYEFTSDSRWVDRRIGLKTFNKILDDNQKWYPVFSNYDALVSLNDLINFLWYLEGASSNYYSL